MSIWLKYMIMDDNSKIKSYTDPSGYIAFLKSKFIPGVGDVYAQKIYTTLGDRIHKIEDLTVKDFQEVTGIGEKLASEIVDSIKKLPVSPALLIFLFSSGLSYSEIIKIINRYGEKTLKVVTEDPYSMVEDVWKFSFFRADKIGKKLGIPDLDSKRLQGALLTSVKLHAEKGSLFATRDQLLSTASFITGLPKEMFIPELQELIAEDHLIESLGGIYLPVYFKAEEETADKLSKIISDRASQTEVKFDIPEKDLEGHTFTEEQRNAILLARDNPISIITGNPGTGKTTTVRGLIRLFEDEGKKVILTAPTGRSTKKLEMTAGASAKTIHRLLGFNRGKGYFNKKFDADVLIIDEASLLEQVLFNHLLQALPEKLKIVLVGDPGQLPPIGAGKVFDDLIESGVVPLTRLTHNFRQQNGSGLALNINRIQNGEIPVTSDQDDFIFIPTENSIETRDKILELVTHGLPSKYNIDPAEIQVVSPQLDGILGTRELNEALQQILQKDSPELSRGSKKFRLGDRVVQSENSNRRGIFNGETGKIIDINQKSGSLIVAFSSGKTSTFLSKELGELSLAYATSVHKLQGTETDFVVMPLTMEHENMLYRKLLLTAVSRARKYCALIGEPQALKKALKNKDSYIRNSNLKLRLQSNIETRN